MAYRYRVHKVKNARFPEDKPTYSVSLVSYSNITLNTIAERINADSSFTVGDVSGVIKNTIHFIAQYLAMGHTVTIDQLGTFTVSAELKCPVTDPNNITGHQLQLKRICFKPAPEFKNHIEDNISFEQYDSGITNEEKGNQKNPE